MNHYNPHAPSLREDPHAFDPVPAFTRDWMSGAWTAWPWPGAPHQPMPSDAVTIYRRVLADD